MAEGVPVSFQDYGFPRWKQLKVVIRFEEQQLTWEELKQVASPLIRVIRLQAQVLLMEQALARDERFQQPLQPL